MNSKQLIQKLMIGGAMGFGVVSVNAFPIAASGTEGNLVLAGSNPVTATYEGNSASYSNDLYLERDALGNPAMDGIFSNDLFLFNNHANSPGNTAAVGTFTAGTELIFRLHVNNTGNDFYSGPGTRNADGLPHARVQDSWAPNTTLVSFEDLLGTPEGASGFNDLSFSFQNTRGVSGVPDGGATAGLLLVGLGAMGALRRKFKA
jgi:hypothetical protein